MTEGVHYRLTRLPGGDATVSCRTEPREGWTQHIGHLALRPLRGGYVIVYVRVHPDWRRLGIATHMLAYARERLGAQIIHSQVRTDDGDAWAHAVGGHIPALVTDE